MVLETAPPPPFYCCLVGDHKQEINCYVNSMLIHVTTCLSALILCFPITHDETEKNYGQSDPVFVTLSPKLRLTRNPCIRPYETIS